MTVDKQASFVKVNHARRMVYGVVFTPNRLTSHGHYVTQDDLETMAHEFLRTRQLDNCIDIFHLKTPVKAAVVESFIARKGDPDFEEGSWVVGVKVQDDAVWQLIVDGVLTAFSATVLQFNYDEQALVTYAKVATGVTAVVHDHQHCYWAEYDEATDTWVGVTDEVNGHSHRIKTIALTEDDPSHTHNHGINLVEANAMA